MSEPESKDHCGFGERGQVIRSSYPVRNAQTEFLRYLLREARVKYLSPASCAAIIAGQPPEVAEAFLAVWTNAHWRPLVRYDEWRVAPCCNSIQQTLKSALCKPEDDYAWHRDCADAAAYNAQPIPGQTRDDVNAALASIGVSWAWSESPDFATRTETPRAGTNDPEDVS